MVFCSVLFLNLSVSHFLLFSFPNFCVPCWVTGNTNSLRYADEAEVVHIHEAVVLMRDSITGSHYSEPVTLWLSELERERDRGCMYSASHFFIFNLRFHSPDHSLLPLLIRPIPTAVMICHNQPNYLSGSVLLVLHQTVSLSLPVSLSNGSVGSVQMF